MFSKDFKTIGFFKYKNIKNGLVVKFDMSAHYHPFKILTADEKRELEEFETYDDLLKALKKYEDD